MILKKDDSWREKEEKKKKKVQCGASCPLVLMNIHTFCNSNVMNCDSADENNH